MSGPALYSGEMNIAKNEDWEESFTYAGPAVDTNGVPVPNNLTGHTIICQVRKTETDHVAYVACTTVGSDGITFDNIAAGQFTILMTRAKLARLVTGDYVSDIVLLDNVTGKRLRLWEGVAHVVEGTSR